MMGDGGDASLRVAVNDALEEGNVEDLAALVAELPSASVATRKACLRSLEAAVADTPGLVEPALRACEALLTDDERSVRLTTAKLCVAVAEDDPDAIVPLVPALAERLGDDEEFYYVRARSAEALGYIALDHPDAVASPAVVADLRFGLSFDGPEVKAKLAKALEHVALGDPGRLTHHVGTLAEHLSDESELVRYHLSTALVAVGYEYPKRLAPASDALSTALDDESAYVRGRAVEALDLLARSEADGPSPETPAVCEDDEAPFVAERVRVARGAGEPGDNEWSETDDGIGSVAAIRKTTNEVVAEITAPDSECPHCGLALAAGGPPLCPRCGTPH
jgi:hypothetical protein